MAERLTKRQRQEQIRAKAAALKAEQARKERQRRLYTALGAVLTVVVVVAALIIVKVSIGDDKSTAEPSGLASDTVLNSLGGIPGTTFDTIGAGSIKTVPKPLEDAPALTADGKPRVLYVGADFCPFCAAERWAVVTALGRFGSFANLGVTSSSSSDVYPDTASLSFHGATYSSSTLSFTGYETTDRNQKALDTITSADQALVTKYDAPPYVEKNASGSIPFVDIGGKYMISGASFDPTVLKGKSQEQIAAALSDPNSDIAKSVVGTANVITAALCQLTKKVPTDVCTSKGVAAGEAKLVASVTG